jgi:hypothetical protein
MRTKKLCARSFLGGLFFSRSLWSGFALFVRAIFMLVHDFTAVTAVAATATTAVATAAVAAAAAAAVAAAFAATAVMTLVLTAATFVATAVAAALAGAFTAAFAGWGFFTLGLARCFALHFTANRLAVMMTVRAATLPAMAPSGFGLGLQTNEDDGHGRQAEGQTKQISLHRNTSKTLELLTNYLVY